MYRDHISQYLKILFIFITFYFRDKMEIVIMRLRSKYNNFIKKNA